MGLSRTRVTIFCLAASEEDALFSITNNNNNACHNSTLTYLFPTTFIIHHQMRLLARQIRNFTSSHLSPKQWANSDDYEVIGELGKGASSKVFQGVHLLSGEKVVIKIFKKSIPP